MAENEHFNKEASSSPASQPPRFYRVAPSVITPDTSSLMARVAAPLSASVQSLSSQHQHSSQSQQQHGFVLSSPPSWSSGVPHCFHLDMTPAFGKSDYFRCDECWRRPEAGWLYTCTQAVVKPDGSIDQRNQALLEPMVYSDVKEGKYSVNEVKILIKQRLNTLNMAREVVPPFYPPTGSGPGYGTLYQGEQAKEESLNPERKSYLRENGLRVRFSEENSYRSPSPRACRDHDEEEEEEEDEEEEEEKGVKVQENTTSDEQLHAMTADEDDFDQYVAWVKTMVNMRTSYIPYRPDYDHGDGAWVQTVEDISVEQQQSPCYYSAQTTQSEVTQPEVLDPTYVERSRREMRSFDYHRAVTDMHWNAQHDNESQQQQSEASRQSAHHSFVDGSNRGPQDTMVAPVPVRSASQNSNREHQNPAAVPMHAQGNQGQDIPRYHDAQVQLEISRGRTFHRQITNSNRAQQPRNNRRTPFVLNIHQSDEEQILHQGAPGAVPAQTSNLNPRPLPQPPPPPPRPSPPRPLYPCDYKLCVDCRREFERLLAKFNAGEDNEHDIGYTMRPVHQPAHFWNGQEQYIFFRPDFADPGSHMNGVLMRDAHYFLSSNNNGPELHHLMASHSTIVDAPTAVNHPAVYGESLASRMERLAVDSSSGGSDASTDESESVDSGEQEIIAGYERDI